MSGLPHSRPSSPAPARLRPGPPPPQQPLSSSSPAGSEVSESSNLPKFSADVTPPQPAVIPASASTDKSRSRASSVQESRSLDVEKHEDLASEVSDSSRRQSTESVRTQPSDESDNESPSSFRIVRHMSSDVPPPDLGRLSVQISRTSSFVGPCTVVPVADRRGLFARLCQIPEVLEPQSYSRGKKWLLTGIVAVAGSTAPMGSAIIIPALNEVSRDFNASQTVTNLSVALYMLSMSIFPLWWSSFSETFGRRTIYLVSFVLFTIFTLLSAVSTNITMFVVMRALSGGAAASVQAVGAGSIADLWDPVSRGRALGLFYIGPLCGPLIAPILGGVITQLHHWRTTQWFLTGFGGLLTLMILFALPETLRRRPGRGRRREITVPASGTGFPPASLERGVFDKSDGIDSGRLESEKESSPVSPHSGLSLTLPMSEKTGMSTTSNVGSGTDTSSPSSKPPSRSAPLTKTQTSNTDAASLRRVSTRQSIHEKAIESASLARRYLLDPLKIVLLLRFPPVLLTVMYGSISFGVLYFLNISIAYTFSHAPYNWNTLTVGFTYVPNGLAFILASSLGGRWLDHIMKREAKKANRYDHRGKPIFLPEDRMRENTWMAAVLFPIALLGYGWAAQRGAFWFIPLMCNFFFSLGVMLIFGTSTTMLTEFMPTHPSHGVALNNFVRNIFSCLGSFLAHPSIESIGTGPLMSILSGISLLTGLITIVLMRWKCAHWREKYGDRLGK